MSAQSLIFSKRIESRFPGLIDKIRKFIEDSEKTYQRTEVVSESFLWEHTTHVATLAFRLSRAEKRNPLIPTIAALFHDAGKFMGTVYHGGEKTEEQNAAEIAKFLLHGVGMANKDIVRVVSGINALYDERVRKNTVADIVHDADFLAKFGAVGVAGFFIKSALRGRTLMDTVLKHLSRELTYAASLPLNMRTAAGRKMAAKKAADTRNFFRALLKELRESEIADLKIRRLRVLHPAHRDRAVMIRLVVPLACPECGSRMHSGWTVEKGLKCDKIRVETSCLRCGKKFELSFCLPEIAS